MNPPKPKATAKSRQILFLNIPEAERARLGTFAETVGRPVSWVVRDAVTLYIDAAEATGLRPLMPDLDMTTAGKTPQDKRGRPKSPKISQNFSS